MPCINLANCFVLETLISLFFFLHKYFRAKANSPQPVGKSKLEALALAGAFLFIRLLPDGSSFGEETL